MDHIARSYQARGASENQAKAVPPGSYHPTIHRFVASSLEFCSTQGLFFNQGSSRRGDPVSSPLLVRAQEPAVERRVLQAWCACRHC